MGPFESDRIVTVITIAVEPLEHCFLKEEKWHFEDSFSNQ